MCLWKHMSQAGINLDASATECFNWSQNSNCRTPRQWFFFLGHGKGLMGEVLVLFLLQTLQRGSTDLSMTFSQLLIGSRVSHFAHRAHGIMLDQLSVWFVSMYFASKAILIYLCMVRQGFFWKLSKAADDPEKQCLSNSINEKHCWDEKQQMIGTAEDIYVTLGCQDIWEVLVWTHSCASKDVGSNPSRLTLPLYTFAF